MFGDGRQPSKSSLHVGRMPLWGGRASTHVDARLCINARATSRSLHRYLISRNFRQEQRARTRELKVVDPPREIGRAHV